MHRASAAVPVRRLGQLSLALGGAACAGYSVWSAMASAGLQQQRRQKPEGQLAAEAGAAAAALTAPAWPEVWPYTEHHLARHDESDDGSFYSQPRLVTHIDDAAIESLRSFYTYVGQLSVSQPPPAWTVTLTLTDACMTTRYHRWHRFVLAACLAAPSPRSPARPRLRC